MEDDNSTRQIVLAVLLKQGHDVFDAANGADGLDLVRKHKPDLVISDVEMPFLGGFAMLTSLRQIQEFVDTPVILLTSLDDRAHMRIGMTQGADDYITKPARAAELIESVNAQLQRVAQREAMLHTKVDNALNTKMIELAEVYERRLAKELGDRWPTEVDLADRKYEMAAVMFVDIQNFAEYATLLAPDELALVTRNLYGNSSDTIHLFNAAHMQFVGEDLIAVFADQPDLPSSFARRAAQAALGMQNAISRCKEFIETRFKSRGLPPLRVGINLNAGPVSLTTLYDPLYSTAPQIVPVGDAVTVVMKLREGDPELPWPIMATSQMLMAAPKLLRTDTHEKVELSGNRSFDVYAVIGPGPDLEAAQESR
jgi:DNA-binding response OmpR family regulator